MTIISDRPIGDDGRPPLVGLIIGWAGVVPFVVAALAPMVLTDYGTVAFLSLAGGVYAALMLSFLGGVRWGMAMSPLWASDRSLGFALSIVAPSAGWIALLIPRIEGLSILIIAFLLQGWLDLRAVGEGRAPLWYGPLRIRLTAAAVVALVVTMVTEVAVIPL